MMLKSEKLLPNLDSVVVGNLTYGPELEENTSIRLKAYGNCQEIRTLENGNKIEACGKCLMLNVWYQS